MARPRIFVSSTYYDLKHVRSSLDVFIKSLGYDSILSEKGDIAYTHDRPLDESCYREAEGADVFVLIIGGRYGSETSEGGKNPSRSFFDRYESITKKEYDSAVTRDVPIYVFVESGVYSEYQTFLRNRDRKDINYAHVDNVGIFHFIEDIIGRPRNNPVHTFERFADIEAWLREQWAGLFRELLHRQSQQQQLMALAAQIAGLKEINETLKKYLEAVMTGASPDVSTKLIASEERRLDELKQHETIKSSLFFNHMSNLVSLEQFARALKNADSFEEFARLATEGADLPEQARDRLGILLRIRAARDDLNELRGILGLEPFDETNNDGSAALTARSEEARRGRRNRESKVDGPSR